MTMEESEEENEYQNYKVPMTVSKEGSAWGMLALGGVWSLGVPITTQDVKGALS